MNVLLELFDAKSILFTALRKNNLINVCKSFFNSIWATSKKHVLRVRNLYRAYKECIDTSSLQQREVIVGQVSEISSEFNEKQNESEKTKENVVEDGNPVSPFQNDIPDGFCCFERNVDPSSDGDDSCVEVLDLDKGSRETTKPIEQSEQFSHKVKKPFVSNTSSLSNHDLQELQSKEKLEVDVQSEMSVRNHEVEYNESGQSDCSDIPSGSVSVFRRN